MAEDEIPTTGGITGPRTDTKDATTPPDNPETDQPDVDKGIDKIGQAGAGH